MLSSYTRMATVEWASKGYNGPYAVWYRLGPGRGLEVLESVSGQRQSSTFGPSLGTTAADGLRTPAAGGVAALFCSVYG